MQEQEKNGNNLAQSEQLLREGVQALKSGQREEARTLLANAIKADPRSEWAWVYLAALLPPEQAITALERAIKLNPANAQAQQGLVTLRHQLATETRSAKTGLNSRMRRDSAAAAGTESTALVSTSDDLRDALSLPPNEAYAQFRKKSRWPLFLLAGFIVVVLGAALVYFLVLNKPATSAQAGPAIAPVLPIAPTTEATVSAVSINAPTEAATTPTPESKPTLLPVPTAIVPLNLRVVQNQRAELKAYALTFNNYDNRTSNFTYAGAGTPPLGKHYEGLLVQLENQSKKVLPIAIDAFQAIDGRNNYINPLTGGRLPALDIPRLQPDEIRTGWLTFEVEDGTTLRRIIFSGSNGPDAGNSAEVNLVAPVATPAPSKAPTKPALATATAKPQPTATPVPTNTATPQPTATPAPTNTATAQPGNNVPLALTISVTAQAEVILPTATNLPATATATLAPTATPLPTATPVPPTPTLAPTTAPPEDTPVPAARAEMKQRYVLGEAALTVSQYVKEPPFKQPPVLPAGYHYEAVRLTLDNLSSDEKQFADNIGAFPFYLRDSENRVYSVGPVMQDGPERFDPKKFLASVSTTPKATQKPAAKQVSGLLYFLVSDKAKTPRTLIFYSSKVVDSQRVEIALK